MTVLSFKSKKEIDREIDREMNKLYFLEKLDFLNDCRKNTYGIFKGCHSIIGIIEKEERDLIMGYINNPCEKKWNQIFHIPITPSDSLLEAFKAKNSNIIDWIENQRDFFNRNVIHWKEIPSAEELITGIDDVISEYERYLIKKIKSFS